MRDKKYIIELGHADYAEEDLTVDGRRVFEHLSDKVPSINDICTWTGRATLKSEMRREFSIACADR